MGDAMAGVTAGEGEMVSGSRCVVLGGVKCYAAMFYGSRYFAVRIREYETENPW